MWLTFLTSAMSTKLSGVIGSSTSLGLSCTVRASRFEKCWSSGNSHTDSFRSVVSTKPTPTTCTQVGNIVEATADKGNIQASSTCHLWDVQRTALRCTAFSEEVLQITSGTSFQGFFCKQLTWQHPAGQEVCETSNEQREDPKEGLGGGKTWTRRSRSKWEQQARKDVTQKEIQEELLEVRERRDSVNEPHIKWNCVTSNSTKRNVAKFSDTANYRAASDYI